jgi:hypothetical protein
MSSSDEFRKMDAIILNAKRQERQALRDRIDMQAMQDWFMNNQSLLSAEQYNELSDLFVLATQRPDDDTFPDVKIFNILSQKTDSTQFYKDK